MASHNKKPGDTTPSADDIIEALALEMGVDSHKEAQAPVELPQDHKGSPDSGSPSKGSPSGKGEPAPQEPAESKAPLCWASWPDEQVMICVIESLTA